MTIAEQIYENARRLPEELIQMRDVHGEPLVLVDGLCVGPYAIHQRASGNWHVTHIASGAGGPPFTSPIEALVFIGVILGSGVHDKMTGADATYLYVPADPIVADRVNAALAALTDWDLDLDLDATVED